MNDDFACDHIGTKLSRGSDRQPMALKGDLVGSRNGAILVGPVYALLSVSSGCASQPNRSWFPSPATSNGACRFPASALLFASQEVMRRSESVVLSILISHLHLLHPIQPLPLSCDPQKIRAAAFVSAFKLRTSRAHIPDGSHPESAWPRHRNLGECDDARMPSATNPREDPGSLVPSANRSTTIPIPCSRY